jgi:mannose-6-phosphate isomerase-like protein (cupin superfamily)
MCGDVMHPKVFNLDKTVGAIPSQSRYSILSEFDCSHSAMIGVIRIGGEQPAGAWEVHTEGDELLMVLSGCFRMTMRMAEGDTVTLEVGPSETLFIPRNVPHSAQLLSPFVSVLFVTPRLGNREWTEVTVNQASR